MDSGTHVKLMLLLCHAPLSLSDLPSISLQRGLALGIIVDNPNRSLVISSLAFRFPLCQLASVATGESQQELMEFLGIDKQSQIKSCYTSIVNSFINLFGSDLMHRNKIYVNYTDSIDPNFMKMGENFGVHVAKIGYNYQKAAVEFVNREFDKLTLKRIQGILNENDISQDSSIVLVNGEHFKPTWESAFEIKHTKVDNFHVTNKILRVPMMKSIQQCRFLDEAKEGFKAISLRLIHSDVYMTFLMPYPTLSLDRLLWLISTIPNFMQTMTTRMTSKTVHVLLPRLQIKTAFDWTDYFSEYGLGNTTSQNNTGLNGILKEKSTSGTNMYISKAKQKVFIQIDETGILRIPGIQMPGSNAFEIDNTPEWAYSKLVEFKADRPFYFTANLKVGTDVHELFNGVYYGPEDAA